MSLEHPELVLADDSPVALPVTNAAAAHFSATAPFFQFVTLRVLCLTHE